VSTWLSGGVIDNAPTNDDSTELRQLVDDIGRRSFDARIGDRGHPDHFDDALWRALAETGLDRLTSTPDFGATPADAAVVLRGLARHAGAVPIAETDLMACWLAREAGFEAPPGPLTVAIARGAMSNGTIAGTAARVPWAQQAAAVVLAVRTADALHVGIMHEPEIEASHNLAGEPGGTVEFAISADQLIALPTPIADELSCRGAWARCCQTIGALDAAAELTVAHTRERSQFGRPLSAFQAVQHALATMAGDIERARAVTTMAVAAADEYGFAAWQTQHAVTVAKVVLGQVVDPVTTIAHQLHGAIGVTAEHPLWLATLRAQAWIDEFGSTTEHAHRLGAAGIAAKALWDIVIQ
jgi:acyl-CoA dehydrogenase